MAGRHSLGVHIGHDRGAALVSNGELVAQVAEERLDRRKHSPSPELPLKSIHAVLDIAGAHAADLGVIGISYTGVEIDKIINLLRDELRDALGAPHLDVLGVGHHDCHAWAAYCTSDVNRALVVVADGAGDIVGQRAEAESLYVASGDVLELVERRLQDFGLMRMSRRNSFLLPYMAEVDRKKDISLGQKYEQFTYLVGFRHREAGKTMGLAAYGEPLFVPEIPRFESMQFPLTFETGLTEIDRVWQQSGQPWHRFVKDRAADIAASGQKLLEEYMLALLNGLNPAGAHTALCAAGGVFLNCQMNGRILTRTKFRELHVVPAAGDDGLSIGAAFNAYSRTFGAVRRGSKRLPFLGPSYAEDDIGKWLDHFGLRAERLEDSKLADRVAADLAGGKVIGLMRGRSETGPRALCHRSILADPRVSGAKDHLNRLKGRELFRPFAPVVTEEDQSKYFELEHRSPYMLLATRLRPQFQAALPAIVHVDGSSRVQALSKSQEPFVHALLRSFEARTGHPVLLNTSFNVAGEPIVESPRDAIVTYLNSALDVLVMDAFYVDMKVPPELQTGRDRETYVPGPSGSRPR
jgi:carbamoyltransferase